MTFLTVLIAQTDKLLLRATPKHELDKRDQDFRKEALTHDYKQSRLVYEALDAIDTKAAAVLQHVSIMIAVCGVFYAKAGSKIFEIVFIVEMLFYVAMALLCLRLLMVQSMSGEFPETKDAVAKEAIMDLTAKLTFGVTLALVASVVVEVIFA